mgnify:CR=1 FL=1
MQPSPPRRHGRMSLHRSFSEFLQYHAAETTAAWSSASTWAGLDRLDWSVYVTVCLTVFVVTASAQTAIGGRHAQNRTTDHAVQLFTL